jgi:hypothetical protein
MNEKITKFEQPSSPILYARLIAKRTENVTTWQSIDKLGADDHTAMTADMSQEFEDELNRLGYEVNRQGKNGWEVRKKEEK